jgi:aminoglycoside phosphotransferase (APT) family kinase protein
MTSVISPGVVLVQRLTPAPAGFPKIGTANDGLFRAWRRLAASREPERTRRLHALGTWIGRNLPILADYESGWTEAARGRTLLHGDLRADNLILDADRVFFVDWTHACVGAEWIDLLGMLPSVAMQGGPHPWRLWGKVPGTEAVNPGDARALLAALTGFFLVNSLEPAPAGLPTVRNFQRAQGLRALTWLRRMMEGPA